MPARLTPFILPGWVVLLALTVLLPILGPGYTLHVDMVFVPQQVLLPWNLGIGTGLPRSVPQDAVVALMAGPLPGQLVQKAVLLAALVLAGMGAARLAGLGLTRQVPAAAIYMWSAFAAARLMMGHWGLLWAFGLLPWVVIAARRARVEGAWLPVSVLCGVSALVPTGGVIAALTALPLTVGFRSVLSVPKRLLLAVWILAVNAPWWLAALRSTSASVSDPLGLVVFGARADGVGGVLLSVLGGGGVWNTQATLGSRTTVFAALGVVTLVVFAALGWRRWAGQARPEAIVVGVLGLLGLTWAWLSGVAAEQAWAQQIVSAVPGGGLLRDGQKWTIWWVLLLAVSAPSGLARLTARAEDSLRVFLAGALAVLPVAMMPDFAAGGFGRLSTAQYPQAWDGLREELADSGEAGDVLSLPWAPFRRYAWNRSQVVLDPLPRYLTRTVVWNDALPVTVRGRVVQVGGDDPRAAAVGRAIQSGDALPPALARLGIRWIVVQRDQPQASRAVDLRGAQQVWAEGDLQLWRVSDPVVVRSPSDALLVTVDVVVLVLLVSGGLVWAARAARHAGRSPRREP